MIAAYLYRPCNECGRSIDLEDWLSQLGCCTGCALARDVAAPAPANNVLAMRGAGMPTAPRRHHPELSAQQRLAAGIPSPPSPPGTPLPLGEGARSARRQRWLLRAALLLGFAGVIAAWFLLSNGLGFY
ncbi:hypothetical protein GCM10007973_18130 [Polymorphobacter multimanifer]|uniref:Uncharacterized protein n=1 Tax=Polymorphobacter multimanifer TaxID=1070431 RepID=A0A841L6U5_9SPHN|nr:hypothetical protein [Polymorphobacter multimanifer]MBB6228327.1 hypothetical protein [Polymorphobacter multimanifer]GGI82066.1 hypothetical protein GCM10007973_18130 [Polymorphobacter multimanifer]